MGERISYTTIKELTETVVRATVLETYSWPAHDLEAFTDKLSAEVHKFLSEAGVPVQRKRRAIVKNSDLKTVQDYLPRNFTACESSGSIHGDVILIEGYDDHGWTLDAYVIPRLASGLIAAKEVS